MMDEYNYIIEFYHWNHSIRTAEYCRTRLPTHDLGEAKRRFDEIARPLDGIRITLRLLKQNVHISGSLKVIEEKVIT